MSSLEQLPPEILFRIFDGLDVWTLYFSLGHTCRRLRTIVNGYDRFTLNFTLLSKSRFQTLLHSIDPHGVVSVTLSHNTETFEAVNMFSSHYRRRKFDRLRSLTLRNIREDQLPSIFKCIETSSLKSLKVTMCKSGFGRATATAGCISATIANSSLETLKLQIPNDRASLIQWPMTTQIQCFQTTASFNLIQLNKILDHAPGLRILSFGNLEKNPSNSLNSSNVSLDRFRQVESLSIETLSSSPNDLEHFLSLTSSVVHLKLVGQGNYLDGLRWERFLEVNLPMLTKFEFFFTHITNRLASPPDISTIARSFRTPFWIDHKKWFSRVQSSRDDFGPSQLDLFSLPICVNQFNFKPQSYRTSLSNAIMPDPAWMDNVQKLQWCIDSISSEKVNISV